MIPLRRPKSCACCTRVYKTAPASSRYSDEGHLFFECICGSTLTVPSLRFEQVQAVLKGAYRVSSGEPMESDILQTMLTQGLDPRDHIDVYADAVDIITRRHERMVLGDLAGAMQ